MSEQALVSQFIRSDASPSGKWFVEVPVGLSVQATLDSTPSVKHVDAVCLAEQPDALPETYPDGEAFYLNAMAAEPDLTKTGVFRRIRDSGQLAGASVALVEAKTGPASFTALGQLEAYQDLLEADYDWSVEERILLVDGDDPVIERVCTERGIRVVKVS
jgi:hypothetical protein